jgi:exportin-7
MRMIYHSFKNAATDQEKFIIELSLINHVVINPLIIEKSNEEIAGMV